MLKSLSPKNSGVFGVRTILFISVVAAVIISGVLVWHSVVTQTASTPGRTDNSKQANNQTKRVSGNTTLMPVSTGITSQQGPMGSRGPQGATGKQGERGPAGANGVDGLNVLTGTGVPSAATGANGQAYVDTQAGNLYVKSGSTWGNPTSLIGPQGQAGANGAKGADGLSVLIGTGAPSANIGVNGQAYVDTQAGNLYVKSGNTWGNPTSLIGPVGATGSQGPQGQAGANGTNGNTVLNGTGAPSNSLGANGDFYLNTTTEVLYGPKANGAWQGSGTSLVGSQGPAGSQGPSGSSPTPYVTTVSSLSHTFSSFSDQYDPGLSVTFTCSNSNETVTITWRLWWKYGTTSGGVTRLLLVDGASKEGWDGSVIQGGIQGAYQFYTSISPGDQQNTESVVLTGLSSGSHTVKVTFFALNATSTFTLEKAQIMALAS